MIDRRAIAGVSELDANLEKALKAGHAPWYLT